MNMIVRNDASQLISFAFREGRRMTDAGMNRNLILSYIYFMNMRNDTSKCQNPADPRPNSFSGQLFLLPTSAFQPFS
jgi:hypothetical protein